ncbi:uncharacterized protein SAPINGB_P004523 [Magnusiomyces paraingens]|uniref:Protein FMP42 n=1 Tax=Magnusiomyces paraingens TaxID=2606893 RepID=A0A5E8BW18_9ASCO|nr:uncharacterized protein SAPINGB_P004523 [Saprochaete ingens]VVT55291.1 unnamed protein product [Saprochaete ingens]
MIDRNSVPKAKRIAQVACSILWCLFVAGTSFGFAALKPVLVSEGVYRERCTPDEVEHNVHICRNQELALNMMFTIAAVVTNISALVVGSALDIYGPRFCGVLGSFLVAAACLVLRGAASNTLFDGYVIGYAMLALAGPFTFISSFHLSNAFPQSSGLILALLTGAFDSSSAVFLFYRLAYQSSGGTFSLYKFFTLFLAVPIFIFVIQVTIMPKESYASPSSPTPEKIRRMSYAALPDSVIQTESYRSRHASFVDSTGAAGPSFLGDSAIDDVEEQEPTEHSPLVRTNTNLLVHSETIEEATIASKIDNNEVSHDKPGSIGKHAGVWGVLHGQSAASQLKTPWFWFMALFTTIQMLRINYFVASVLSQYTYLLGGYEKAVQLNKFFDVALPLGGLISIPFIGLALDNLSTFGVLSVLLGVSTTFGVLGMIPNSFLAGALNISLLVVYRPFYYTSVSDYAAKVFGFETFGRIYGVIICIAGVLNVLQAQLDATTHNVFAGNPTPVNIMLVSITIVIGISFLTYVKVQVKRIQRKSLEQEAQVAPVLNTP